MISGAARHSITSNGRHPVSDHHEHGRSGEHDEQAAAAMFEPAGWDERYAGQERFWSGEPNPQLVATAGALTLARLWTSDAARAGTSSGWPARAGA